MATLPRGIQQVQYKDTCYYRVRISRKDFKADKYFKDLDEAKEFLALSKAKKGKELIYSITEEQRRFSPEAGDYSFGYFVDLYIKDYLSSPCSTELEQRNRNNKLSFLKTIKNTGIIYRQISSQEKEELGWDSNYPYYKFFHAFDVRKIKAIDINNYIKRRLETVKPITVSRELTYISTVFRKLQYFDESLADVQNPVPQHDRDLIKNRTTKREFVLSDQDESKLFETLASKRNKELWLVAQASLLTGMRRSEILTLKPDQIKENYIQLIHTKSGRPRKVYLTKDAKKFFEELVPAKNDKIFKYTIGGYDRVFREVMNKAGIGYIHFHDLRRTNISRLLTKIGHDNTILATEILGIQSVKKFEELHLNADPVEPTTQFEAVKNWHSSAQMTKGYYNIVFNLNKSNTSTDEKK